MSNKIKKLMVGGRSRLEKRAKKKAHAASETAAENPILTENQGIQAPEPLPEQIISSSAAPEPHVEAEKPAAAEVTAPKETLKETIDRASSDTAFDALSPQMRQSLQILQTNNITLECLQTIESMFSKNKEFMEAFLKLGPQSIAVFCNIAKDEDYVITTKIKLIALLNRISRNEIVHKLFRRIGAAIEALRRLKELLLLQ